MMGQLMFLTSMSADLEKKLNDIGIYFFQEFCTIGVKKAWLTMKELGMDVNYDTLINLEAALEDRNITALNIETINDLKEYYEFNK